MPCRTSDPQPPLPSLLPPFTPELYHTLAEIRILAQTQDPGDLTTRQAWASRLGQHHLPPPTLRKFWNSANWPRYHRNAWQQAKTREVREYIFVSRLDLFRASQGYL